MRLLTPTLPQFCVALLVVLASTVAFSASENFLRLPIYSDVQLSPDGKYIAAKVKLYSGRQDLMVREIGIGKTRNSTIKNDDLKWNKERGVSSYAWIDNENLLLTCEWGGGSDALTYVRVGSSEVRFIRASGKYTIVDPIPGESRYIVAKRPKENKVGTCEVIELDIRNRKHQKILYTTESKDFVAYTNRKHELSLVRERNSEDGPLKFKRINSSTGAATEISLYPWTKIYGFDYDGVGLWVGGDFEGLQGVYRYNLVDDKVDHKLAAIPQFQLNKCSELAFSEAHQQLVGIHADLTTRRTDWMHGAFANLQSTIDKALKGSNNRLTAWTDDLKQVVVERTFPDLPPQTFVVDFNKPKVEFIYSNSNPVDQKETSIMKKHRVANRTDQDLDVFLTTPRNAKKPVPLVVVVRDKPWETMDSIQWYGSDQYLASFGYAVMRVNFRGSGIYGGDMAVYWNSKEDALKAIYDIEDAIKWAKDHDKADTSKTAIIGYGAGGWIASYTAVRNPSFIKAFVGNTGVYDLTGYRNEKKKKDFNNTVGVPFAKEDSKLSDQDLADLSPLHQISNLKAAVMVTYGTWTGNNFIMHTRDFTKEAKKAGLSVEKIFSDVWSGTAINNDEVHMNKYKAIAKFLKKHMK